jgi:hypothetical protein
MILALFLSSGTALFAQSAKETERAGGAAAPGARAETAAALPLRRVSLFSSGVAYFERSLTIGADDGTVEIPLSFPLEAVNDVLKSLVINDPGPGDSPEVRYPQADVLSQTLGDLAVDLSGQPRLRDMLMNLQGEWIEIAAPGPIRGRIIGVEQQYLPVRPGSDSEVRNEPCLSLYTAQGIRVIALRDIVSISFTDPRINADLSRALDLLSAFRSSRHSRTRTLSVSFPEKAERTVTVSYVIPAPVWKVSYRLDLSGEKPLLQAWAIVDNGSGMDWNGIEVSLVTGRSVSFIQDLYSPYRVSRPVLPLGIAGIADARTYDSGWTGVAATADTDAARKSRMYEEAESPALGAAVAERARAEAKSYAPAAPAPAPNVLMGTADNSRGADAGDQFEFTFKKPVNLGQGESVMLPLFEGFITAEKTLVFSGDRASGGGLIHPAISAELRNTTGMKLPAGPVAVYDGGVYAGDALIAFLPENEKRIISWGEDLSVTGSVRESDARITSAVTVSGGVMTISRRMRYEKIYTLKNASAEEKRLLLEHPIIRPGAVLVEPASFAERTDRVYRFSQTLPAGEALTLNVREEIPAAERIILSRLNLESFAAYASSAEIPAAVRSALQRAAELRRKADEARQAQGELEERRTRLIAEQDRIRRNLEAAGNQTPQGQEYLKRMAAQDAEIDGLNVETGAAAVQVRAAQKEYEDYLSSLEL